MTETAMIERGIRMPVGFETETVPAEELRDIQNRMLCGEQTERDRELIGALLSHSIKNHCNEVHFAVELPYLRRCRLRKELGELLRASAGALAFVVDDLILPCSYIHDCGSLHVDDEMDLEVRVTITEVNKPKPGAKK